MLHRLEIENFYSIRERQIIDLRAAAHAPDDDNRLAPIWKGATEKAPKVVALFGANASGKSNVLRALSFITWFVKDSFALSPGAPLPFERFNSDEARDVCTSLSIHVVGPENIDDKDDPEAKMCRYAYELLLSGGPAKTVLGENLYYWPSHASRRLKLFERNVQGHVTASKAFELKGHKQALEKVLRPNASVISTLAQLGHEFSTLLKKSAEKVGCNILIEKGDYADDFVISHYANHPILTQSFNDEIERIDAGIKGLRFEPGLKGPVALFTHEGLGVPVPLIFESHGTRQFMKLYPLLFYALETGGIAVIDELDSALHPVILAEVLGWFHSPVRNPYNAQLWISCHNASILEDLIKEEVFFCEKDKTGQTHVYGLKNIQAVRRDDNYYRKYLGGFYGAVPQIG